ncbi:hypothetical protein LTR84_006332 [Exophiala bonariae]|uniref:Non-homologous end-joining factor 1 n=1 Tax=Exophiala bonariae TaxID=1690606 RepID=A0AAV9N184_9EURO|nr:hypothetical protein LTR84_006332 [Exophiala bonariae]
MGTTNEEGWQELRLPSREECPKLFYSFHTSKDAFSLLLTDLIAIWDCSLDKYDILAEAARQDASIDPSESARQFGLLLSKLRESLQHEKGQNVLARDSNHLSRNLLLRTKIDLPRPLKPLTWIFRLEQKNASQLAEQLLRPSLHEVSVSEDKITSLLHTIKEKDHVISRLLDRIKTSGIDLGLDFPSFAIASSRKGGQLSVADAKRHVPGMAEFDHKSWIKQFSNDDGYEGADRTGLKNLVKGCEKCFVHTREQHEDWLSGLTTSDNKRAILVGGINAESGLDRGGVVTLSSKWEETPTESDNDDDDFERQPTPPKLHPKDANKQGTRSSAQSGDTEAESDDDIPKKKTTTKLGILGRRNATKAYGDSKANPRSSPVILRRSASPPLPSREASGTATESDSEVGSHPHRKGYRRPLKGPPKQKSRLGGLKKPSDKKSSPSSPSEDEGYAPPKTNEQQKSSQVRETSDPDSPPAPSSNHRRPGQVNKTKEPPPSRSPSSTPEADDLEGSSPPQTRGSQKRQPPPKAQSPPAPRRLGRLGGLGGGRKGKPSAASSSSSPQPSSSRKKASGKPTPDVEMTDEDTPSPSPSPSPSSKPTTRQHTNHTSSSPSTKKSSPSTSKAKSTAKQQETEAEEQPPEQEETDEAKANRRREELKRSIASGAGVRKKRRF